MDIPIHDLGDGVFQFGGEPSDSPLDELIVFVAVEPNGNEGIMAGAILEGLPFPFQGAMVFRLRRVAAMVEPFAREFCQKAGKGFRILRFKQRKEVRTLQN